MRHAGRRRRRAAAAGGRAPAGSQLVVDAVDPDLRSRVDRGQLERSLINLGSNAVKFTPAGGQATIAASGLDGQVVPSP